MMPYTIMLVDDDESLIALTGLILKRAGYTIQQAYDGYQALEALADQMPDLFIVDVMMPGMDGFELCRQLRAKPETAQHPIILLSARTDQDSIFEGLSSGANLYLGKPIPPDELIARIKEFLNEEVDQQ
jgi:DNA-binding response OmpR family regulator